MDINRDELRRQLRESQREHDALMPRFRSILARVFDPDSAVSTTEKAQLLGVPSRRALIGGGATLAGAALIAACSEPTKKTQLAQTGTVPDAKTTTTIDPKKAAEAAQKLDLNLLRTSQSVEALAIATYTLALSTNKLDPAIADTVRLFQTQHTDHKGALVTQIQAIGGEKYTNPSPGKPPAGVSESLWAEVNPTIWKEAVEPAVKDANALTQESLVKLATALEDVAASTYTKLGGVLSSADLRAFIMSIGGIEARHVAVLLGVTNPGDPRQQAPFPFQKTANAVPPESYVGSGEVRGAARTTTTTAKPTGTTTRSATATTARAGGTTATTAAR